MVLARFMEVVISILMIGTAIIENEPMLLLGVVLIMVVEIIIGIWDKFDKHYGEYFGSFKQDIKNVKKLFAKEVKDE